MKFMKIILKILKPLMKLMLKLGISLKIFEELSKMFDDADIA